jgi:hypothetical protein
VAAPADERSATDDETLPRSHGFSVPRPRFEGAIAQLSVTDFKDYLECPYRFYLKRVLKLKSVVRDLEEMDPLAFGTLLHEVLGQFGHSPVRDSSDANEIEGWLLEALEQICRKRFGTECFPAVELQREQMGWRLKQFALHQARWRKEGWRIVLAESDSEAIETDWLVDEQMIRLRGRVDRVDRHDRGTYAILDYKSSDGGDSPETTHHGGNKPPKTPDDWKDLQLPMYRHFARQLGIAGEIELGYITLPRSTKNAGFQVAKWTPDTLEMADEAARQVVRALRAGEFWGPKHFKPGYDRGLDRICQVRVFDRRLEAPPERCSELRSDEGITP